MKKYFIFSDVHGVLSSLLESLETAGFDKDNPEHILFSLGDNFDRGLEHKELLSFLLEYWRKDRFIGILGNHDEFFKQFLIGKDDGFFNVQYNGMDKTVAQLSGINDLTTLYKHPEVFRMRIKENYPELLKFLDSMISEKIIGKYHFSHAGLKNYSFLSGDDARWVVDNWARTDSFIYTFDKQDYNYVFGHWHAYKLHRMFSTSGPNDMDHTPFIYENFIGTDTCTNLSMEVNVLVLEEDSELIKFNGEEIPDGRDENRTKAI